ncbi:unnamed protein product, partial [Choristocarpus tenellus]
VRDLERRCALQLAWLRRYPQVRTECCNQEMCFKCKTSGWHLGLTCAEKQAEGLNEGVQSCPGCNVPTIKSEGCNHIVCVSSP